MHTYMRLFDLAGIVDAKSRQINNALARMRMPLSGKRKALPRHLIDLARYHTPIHRGYNHVQRRTYAALGNGNGNGNTNSGNSSGIRFVPPPSFADVQRPGTSSSSSGRAFTYTVVGAAGVMSAMAAKSTVLDFLTSLSAAGTVLALSQVEVDLATIPQGKNVVIKWRGKPIFIRHRTPDEIREAEEVPLGDLRDPQRDADRVQRPEWLVMLGICTHLGCVPLGESGDYGGCGSHYDVSGRVRKGPAPLNMEIPKYSFLDDTRIVIG